MGTIDSFYDAHMDLISPMPVFNLYNSEWPIYTRQSNSPPAKFVRGEDNTVGTALDSIVASGVVISGGIVEAFRAVQRRLRRHRRPGCMDSVLMDKVSVGEGAVIKRAILDKNVKVPAGAAIGLDRGPGPRPAGSRSPSPASPC